jgi:hypothetical protein
VLRSLLVKCLNIFQKTVSAAHLDPKNQPLLEKLQASRIAVQIDTELKEAQAVPDNNDIGDMSTGLVEGKCARKPVDRCSNLQFGEDSNYLDLESEEEMSEKKRGKQPVKETQLARGG